MPRCKVLYKEYEINRQATWDEVYSEEHLFPTIDEALLFLKQQKYNLINVLAQMDEFFKIKNYREKFDFIWYDGVDTYRRLEMFLCMEKE